MKVLILSLPRCYTKNLVNHISNHLPGEKLERKISPREFRPLGEILHFNECSVLGYDKNKRLVTYDNADKFFVHKFNGNNFYYVDTNRIHPVPEKWLEKTVEILETTSKSFVLKIFPIKFDEIFQMDERQKHYWINRLINTCDLVIGVLRKDSNARILSLENSLKYGFIDKDIHVNSNLLSMNNISNSRYNLLMQDEFDVRKIFVKYNIPILYSEDIAAGVHDSFFAQYGIFFKEKFPNIIEYSKMYK